MTIDKEYTSDLSVGFPRHTLPTSRVPKNSGALYRSVWPWLEIEVEALTESMFFTIDQRPDSEIRGVPSISTRMFDWER